ncbi:glycosyltransferase family 2 protein [Planctomicrobium sp. SH661]|uniref:glycosyltransferase family 2 protein n=1 Tax=Planctomicrobium sp. SH661 TaxID=3448124 RepID=UPI003F5C6674
MLINPVPVLPSPDPDSQPLLQLTGRPLKIAAGETPLPVEKVRQYRERFADRGYLLPEWDETRSPAASPEEPPVPAHGPGTELKKLIDLLKLPPKSGCSCNSLRTTMDRLGVAGCRKHRDRLISQLQANYKLFDWKEKLAAGMQAVISGLAFRIDLTDPIPALFDEAVRRAEQSEDQKGELERLQTADTELPSSAVSLPPAVSSPHPLAKSVTRFIVGITSAPRKSPTLARCVESVIAAGFAPTVYAEPGTDVGGLPCPVVVRPERLGCWRNYVQTLRDLLAADPLAQAVVIFQDDIIIARETREFLEHDLWPSDRVGAVSLYSPDFNRYELRRPQGFNRVQSKWIMGACAMVYPRAVAESLARHTDWRGGAKSVIEDPVKKKAVDTWIGHVLHAEKKHIYYPNPSLCQHIAKTSSIGHGGNNSLRKGRHFRRSGKFAGEETTPFELFTNSLPYVRYDSEGSMRLAEPLSVIIPAWNCFDLTQKCLTELAENAGVSPLDVIYIDNGSDAGVVDQVRNLAEKLALPLRTVEFPENRGFAIAVNAGLEIATGHVLLLNNDCYVHKGCLPALLRHLLSDDRVASVGPLTADQGSQSIKRHRDMAKQKGKRKSLERNMVAGFCQLKRKEAIAQIGLLDENLPHGLGTDDDWCHRARATGWKILLALDAFADHDHKSTFHRSGQDRRQLQLSAREYLREKGVL